MPGHLPLRLLPLTLLWAATPALADPGPDSGPDSGNAAPTALLDAVSPTIAAERAKLRDAGLDLTAAWTSEAATNTQGGDRHATTETSQLVVGVTGDADKLFGIRGGTFQATLTYRRGDNLVAKAGLDTLLQVQEVYGRGQTVRLTEFWYQQDFGNGIDLKLGRLPVGGDLSSFPCDHMNGAYCGAPIGNIGGDFWYNWPVSQWAARLRYQHSNWYVMAGAYEVNPRNLDNDFFIGHFHGATGVLVPVEAGVKLRLGAHRLPGTWRVGGWYSSDDADDVLLGRNGQPAVLAGTAMQRRSGRYGGFAIVQQQLTGRAIDVPGKDPQTVHGLTAFVTVTQADRDTARIDNQVTSGLRYLGLVPHRPNDSLQFSAARTHVNGRAALLDVLQIPGSERPGSEYEIEADYGAQIMPWLTVQPNVQYIVHPGGYAQRDAVVLGVKTVVAL